MPDEAAVHPEATLAAAPRQRLLAAGRFAMGWPLLGISAAGLAVAIVNGVLRSPGVEVDTIQVVLGALRGLRCLRGGGGGTCQDMSYFPPLQYLPGGLILAAGGSPDDALLGLVWLNLAAWMGTALLLALALRRARGGWAAALGLAAWVGSYGLAYANSSFGEVLTGFLALAFTVGCARAWPWVLVGILGMLAGMGKETAPPFLALLGAGALVPSWARAWEARRFPWASVLALVVAVGGGAGANATFNLWRYGQSGNPFLLQPILRAPGIEQWMSSFGALWVSPNGGLLLFAPAAVALTLGAGLWALGRAWRRADAWTSMAPALLAPTVLLGMTAGLAGWYSPFGWWAWGPRLVLPLLPACLYLALASPLPWEVAATRVLSGSPRFLLAVGLVGGAVVVHAAALVDHGAYLEHFTRNPVCGGVIIQQDPVGFFDYLDCLMWNTDRFMLGRMVRAALAPSAIWTSTAAVLLQVALLWRARDARTAPP